MPFKIFKNKIYKNYKDAKLEIQKDIYYSNDYFKRNAKKIKFSN